MAVVLVAVAGFAAVAALGFSVYGADDAVLLLNVPLIALVAARFGRWVGLAVAVCALAEFAVWAAAWRPFVSIGPLGYFVHAVVFVLVGWSIGWYAERFRALVRTAYASEDRYRAVLEHAPEAIAVIDLNDGSLPLINHRALTLFGLSRTQLTRLGPELLLPHRDTASPADEELQEKINEATAGQQPVFRRTYRASNGHDLPCEVRLARMPDPDRVLLVATITEITEHVSPPQPQQPAI